MKYNRIMTYYIAFSMSNCVVTNLTRSPIPKLPYRRIATDIIGESYKLSVVFVGTRRAKNLNQTHRQKTYTPNILSFPLAKGRGEIFICPAVVKKEATRKSVSVRSYTGYIYIHGLLHLNGFEHSVTMEKAEECYVTKYGLGAGIR